MAELALGAGVGWSTLASAYLPSRPIRSLAAEDRSAEGVRDRTGLQGLPYRRQRACQQDNRIGTNVKWPHTPAGVRGERVSGWGERFKEWTKNSPPLVIFYSGLNRKQGGEQPNG